MTSDRSPLKATKWVEAPSLRSCKGGDAKTALNSDRFQCTTLSIVPIDPLQQTRHASNVQLVSDLNKSLTRFGLPIFGRGIIYRVRLSHSKACAVAR